MGDLRYKWLIATGALLILGGVLIGQHHHRTDVMGYTADDPVMNQSYADARASVQDFITQLSKPKPDWRYLVQMRVTADGVTEHMWTDSVTYENDVFTGRIANKPLKITSIKEGDTFEAKKTEISDWVIIDNQGDIVAGGFGEKAKAAHPGVTPD